MTSSHIDDPNYLLQALMPLRSGMTVRLVQETVSRHGRLQIERVKKTGLLLAPGQLYGLRPDSVVISLLGRGSCVVIPSRQRGVGEIAAMGVPQKLATALFETLTKVYGVTQQ